MLLDVVAVKPLDDYKILITFENGERRIFDVTPLLDKPRWQELKDERLFRLVKVYDGTVQWPGQRDICPCYLYNDSQPYTEEG